MLNLFIEPKLKQKDAFIEALQQELIAFAKFNNCSDFKIQTIQTKKAQ
ncbi:hypothetical protein JCM19241_1240 [Vibrio ishigakensis]|uniref:Uncharacterized protein n=1 Tax=Vibrio ishigakensis TaxID=1481914 RepID=A0A0B8QDB8_9VIBR|nr:hypothetical protein JCM19241_1240 [Vibrio ishigakensis]